MRNTLVSQCFHSNLQRMHKSIFELFPPFLLVWILNLQLRYYLSCFAKRSLENLQSSYVTSGLSGLLVEVGRLGNESQCFTDFCWFFCLSYNWISVRVNDMFVIGDYILCRTSKLIKSYMERYLTDHLVINNVRAQARIESMVYLVNPSNVIY